MKRINYVLAALFAVIVLSLPVAAQAETSYSIQDYPVDAYLTSSEKYLGDQHAFSFEKDATSRYVLDSADRDSEKSVEQYPLKAALSFAYRPLLPLSTQVPDRAQQRQNLYKVTFKAGEVYTLRYAGVEPISETVLAMASLDTTVPPKFGGNEMLYFYDESGQIVSPTKLEGTVGEEGINIWLPMATTTTYYIGCSSKNACAVTEPYAIFKDVGDYRLAIRRTTGAVIYFDAQDKTTPATDVLDTTPAKITRPADPKRYGKKFEGWYLEPECIHPWKFESDEAYGSLTLYAKWSDLPQCQVSFISQGSVCATESIMFGEKAYAPQAPVRSGYTFKGWYADEALTTPWNFTSDTVAGNTNIYAKWASNNSYLRTIKKSTGTWSRTMPFKQAGGSMRLYVSSSKSILKLEPVKSSSKAKRYIKIGTGKYYRLARVTMSIKRNTVKVVKVKVVSESGRARYYTIYVTRR